jgi:hypothetical protein
MVRILVEGVSTQNLVITVQNGSSKPEREPGNSSNKRSGKVEDNGHKDGGPEDLRTRKDLRMEAPKHPTSTL